MTITSQIKRYSNRKLYDVLASKYITLVEIASRIKAGESFYCIDNSTKQDITNKLLMSVLSTQTMSDDRLKDLIVKG